MQLELLAITVHKGRDPYNRFNSSPLTFSPITTSGITFSCSSVRNACKVGGCGAVGGGLVLMGDNCQPERHSTGVCIGSPALVDIKINRNQQEVDNRLITGKI
jgi:hypothetical protein